MCEYDDIVWKPVSSTEVFDAKVVRVCEKKSVSPEGVEKTFTSLKAPDWVIVIPIYKQFDKDEVFIMVKQWRHGAEKCFMEFPGGVINEGEAPEEAAFRELLEETGRRAVLLQPLGELSPNPAIMENTCYVYLALVGNSSFDMDWDEDEFIKVAEISREELMQNMGRGEYSHAIMNAAMFLYLQFPGFSAE